MISAGRFQIYRSAFYHSVVGIDRPLRFSLWAWLVAEARFRKGNGLERGQLKASDKQLREVVKMKDATFRDFKRELVESGMVEIQRGPTHRAPSVWTIVNYEEFQSAPSGAVNSALTPPLCDVEQDSDNGDSKRNDRPMPRASTNQLKKEGSQKEGLEKNTTAVPADPVGSGGEVKPKRKPKAAKPSVPAFGSWPELPTNAKAHGFIYPDEFETVWQIWRGVGAKNAAVKQQATGKWNSYRLCLRWLHNGISAEDLAGATRAYLQPFWNEQSKTHCKLPSTLYSHENPVIPDLCDTSRSATSMTDGRSAFKYPQSALRAAGVQHDINATASQKWALWDALSDEVKSAACKRGKS